jgi:hypothetical protein
VYLYQYRIGVVSSVLRFRQQEVVQQHRVVGSVADEPAAVELHRAHVRRVAADGVQRVAGCFAHVPHAHSPVQRPAHELLPVALQCRHGATMRQQRPSALKKQVLL